MKSVSRHEYLTVCHEYVSDWVPVSVCHVYLSACHETLSVCNVVYVMRTSTYTSRYLSLNLENVSENATSTCQYTSWVPVSIHH